jgi:hypothetical protein
MMSKIFNFSVILEGVNDKTPDLEDSLFEAGCDDALINYKNSIVYLDFDREAESLEKAILSAIKSIESSTVKAKVKSISSGYLVGMSDIAEKLGLTRQSLSLLINGKRGPGSFPAPVFNIENKSPLWRWHEVSLWLYEQGKIEDLKVIQEAKVIEDINAALSARNSDSFLHQQEILNELNNVAEG